MHISALDVGFVVQRCQRAKGAAHYWLNRVAAVIIIPGCPLQLLFP